MKAYNFVEPLAIDNNDAQIEKLTVDIPQANRPPKPHMINVPGFTLWHTDNMRWLGLPIDQPQRDKEATK